MRLLESVAAHPVRHVAQNAALWLGPMRRLQEQRSTTGAMNDPDVMIEWAQYVVEIAQRHGVDLRSPDTTFVEVGPGHSLGVAVSLLAAGAGSGHAIDVVERDDAKDPSNFEGAVGAGRARGFLPEEASIEASVETLNYRAASDGGDWPLADDSVDVVYSYFAGEHLRDPSAILRETARVLRPGGVTIWWIDLTDHLEPEGHWLRFLNYSERLWEAMTSRRGCWCNRLRASEWEALFSHWFDIAEESDLERAELPSDFSRDELAEPYAALSDDELAIRTIRLVGIGASAERTGSASTAG